MNKINMAELLADREKGTANGPWHVWQALGKAGVSDPFADIAHCSGFYSRRSLDEEIVNASRIARLPDLEAAFIEAVEALEKTAAQLADLDNRAMDLQLLCDKQAVMLAEARAEIERLRAFVQSIITDWEENDVSDEDEWSDGYDDCLSGYARLARAALAPKGEGE